MNPITFDVEEFRRLWASGATCAEIGRHFGFGYNWASDQAKKLGLPRRATKRGALPVYAIRVAYANGKTSAEIADELRAKFPTLSPTTIRRLIRKAGDKTRPGRVRSNLNPAECVRLLRAGWTRDQIAARFKSTNSRVAYAIRRVLGAGPRGGGTRVNVSEIRFLRAQGLTQREVARRVGCHRATVQRVTA